MPEGPELHITMMSINKICSDVIFTGAVVRNPIHKCEDINWDQPAYRITAQARGKELMLRLQTVSGDHTRCHSSTAEGQPMETSSILFTFGMSGQFVYTETKKLPKHSHLTFYSRGEPQMALSFVDARRFGRWQQGGQWSSSRGPCVIQEYTSFVQNIVSNLSSTEFNKPICELMLNQRYFSGIGNYLRAEVLFRCEVPPFVKASSVLRLRDGAEDHIAYTQSVACVLDGGTSALDGRTSALDGRTSALDGGTSALDGGTKTRVPDHGGQTNSTLDLLAPQAQELLRLCHLVSLEVVQLGSSKYVVSDLGQEGEAGSFEDWLQCYNQATMTSLADHNKRTIWFSGPAGPMVPADGKPKKAESKKKRGKPAKPNVKVVGDNSQDLRGTAEASSDRKLAEVICTDKTQMAKPRNGRTKQTPKVNKTNQQVIGGATEFVESSGNKRPHKSRSERKNEKVKLTDDGNGALVVRVTRSTVGSTKVI